MQTRNRRRAVALLMNVAGTRDDYEGGMRRGVEQACEAYDLDLLIYAGRSTCEETADAQRMVYRLVHQERVDAVIVASGILASYIAPKELESIIEGCRPLPVVTIGPSVAKAPAVLVANQRGARAVVRHLIEEHGCQQFVCISGPAGHPEARERLETYRTTLREYGLDLPDEAVSYGRFIEDSGVTAMTELLQRQVPFDALLAANDYMAVGALDALTAAGISCPGDVAIVGFDDASISRYCEPPLTTLRQPLALQGASAIEILRRYWAGESDIPDARLDVELVLRSSCGCRPDAQLSHPSSAKDRSPSAVGQLLGTVLGGPAARRYADRVSKALVRVDHGQTSELREVLSALFDEVVSHSVRADLLPDVVQALRHRVPERSPATEDSFHWAQVEAGRRAYRAQGRRNVGAERTVYDVRLAWERLSTALSVERLSEALAEELPRQGVNTGVVSVYADDSLERLLPVVSIYDGERQPLVEQTFPANRLLPPEWVSSKRRTLVVMPLTFQHEQLGVAVLETGEVGFHDLLREQIGGALKRARIHEELLRQTRLHARSREEERATSERLRSLHLIAGGVAHDLNNVLGPLVALPEAIRRDLQAKDPAETLATVLEDLDTMQLAAARASLTIRDLMDLGRPTSGRAERLELTEVFTGPLRRQLEEVATDRNPRAQLVIDVPVSSLVVRVSESHLERCITNLVLNAVDALPGHGRVTVRARPVRFKAPHFGFERIEAGNYACIEVEDTGVGISPQKIHRVVEPFYSEKRRSTTGGTGLGLAIVRRFVKDASGYLDIESEVGRGTTFRIFLPQRRISTGPTPSQRGGVRGDGETILVVDDEPVQRRSAKRVLTSLGYRVTCVGSGEEALELFRAPAGPEFDLVILDMVMGDGLDGVETYRRILDEYPDQRAMIASGYASEQKGTDAAALGLKWLTKPYTFDALGTAVRKVLDPSR